MTIGLTKAEIEAAIAEARSGNRGQVELRDIREPGLRFRAGERTARWSLVIRLRNGKRSRVGLGSWPALGIAQARAVARDVRLSVEQGGDPNEDKRNHTREAKAAARARRSIADLLDDYEAAVLSYHRRGAQTRRALDGEMGLLKKIRSRAVQDITRSDLNELVKRRAKVSPISANRQLAYAKAFFNWCVADCVIETNPAANVRKPAPERARDRYHSLDELRDIWAAADSLGYPFAHLYKLLIVLPMRREEIAGIWIGELELRSKEPVWILPASRTKRSNALRVPILPLAKSILEEAIADRSNDCKEDYIFTTTGETPVSGFAKGRRRLDAAIQERREKLAKKTGFEADPMLPWTVHDLRTTFATLACDRLKISAPVADRILNHVATATTSKIMRVYNRSEMFDERKKALRLWEQLIKEQIIAKIQQEE